MEMTYEEYRIMVRGLRKKFSVVGWILLIYYGIMNAAVLLSSLVESVIGMLRAVSSGDLENIYGAAYYAAESAWGYFLAAAIGLVILFLWKKKDYWKNEIWAKGRPMSFGSFLGLLCIFMSGQLVYQFVMTVTEVVLNIFGLSVLEGMQAVAMDTGNFSMFLYGGILAPVTEEILFRGLIQRTLLPWGKRFAIVCSAFTFGIFHGNLLQTPYAFLVGLVLGYVACEYSIGWAMVLHMVNNMVLGDTLTRLTSGLPEMAAALVIWGILLLCGIGALVTLIVRRREVKRYRRENPLNRTLLRSFFSCPGIIALMVVMGANMVLSLFMMITPL